MERKEILSKIYLPLKYLVISIFYRENNTEIVAFMKENNITDAKLLEAYYLAKIFEIVESYKPSKKSYAGKVVKNIFITGGKFYVVQNLYYKSFIPCSPHFCLIES